MAHRLLRDTEADGWERSDFPILCETCLGPNPYVRMTKADFDKECKICTRPFTVFRWRPGRDARYKKTEICQTCSKLKNVCQVCLFDLEFGLPVQVRDSALNIDTDAAIPKSDVNREYFAEEQDRMAKAGLDYESSFGKARPNDMLLKLQRTTPYYQRNRAHICSFYVRGECTRGAECPYRHEMPITGELADQNIKDRYYGVNDPVANKLMRQAGEMPSLDPPEDPTIKTLYVGGLDDRISDKDLKDHFYGYGEIEYIRMLPSKHIAFVCYTTREAAERAAENLAHKLVVKGVRLKLLWARPSAPRPAAEGAPGGAAAGAAREATPLTPADVLALPSPAGPSGLSSSGAYAAGDAPAAAGPAYYPSMDPQRMGAVVAGGAAGQAAPGGPPSARPPYPAVGGQHGYPGQPGYAQQQQFYQHPYPQQQYYPPPQQYLQQQYAPQQQPLYGHPHQQQHQQQQQYAIPPQQQQLRPPQQPVRPPVAAAAAAAAAPAAGGLLPTPQRLPTPVEPSGPASA